MTDNVKPREGGKYSLYCYDCDTWIPNTANHEMRKEGVIAHSHICSKHEKYPNKDEYYLSKTRRLQSENRRLKKSVDNQCDDCACEIADERDKLKVERVNCNNK